MKYILSLGIYIVIVPVFIYLGINYLTVRKRNKQLTDGVTKLNIIHELNQNLINVEQNVWQINQLFSEYKDEIELEKNDSSTIRFSELLKNDSIGLIFFFHENSCFACLEIEFNHIKDISDSLKMPVHFVCKSEGWRSIKLIQQSNSFEDGFYRLIINNEYFNDELFFFPFYLINDKMNANFVFIPLKENPQRTQNFFKFIQEYSSFDRKKGKEYE